VVTEDEDFVEMCADCKCPSVTETAAHNTQCFPVAVRSKRA
jgi:hypothetical protein